MKLTIRIGNVTLSASELPVSVFTPRLTRREYSTSIKRDRGIVSASGYKYRSMRSNLKS